MMEKVLQQIEQDIRRAVQVDRVLPAVFKNRYRCPLGSMIKPEVEEQIDKNLNGEPEIVLDHSDYELWVRVTDKWLPKLFVTTQKIIWWRCSGMGWKSIGRRLNEEKFTCVEFHRNTLFRYFKKGLEEIAKIMGCAND